MNRSVAFKTALGIGGVAFSAISALFFRMNKKIDSLTHKVCVLEQKDESQDEEISVLKDYHDFNGVDLDIFKKMSLNFEKWTKFMKYGYLKSFFERPTALTFIFLDIVDSTRRLCRNGTIAHRMQYFKDELVKEFSERKMDVFVVSNGGDGLFLSYNGPIDKNVKSMLYTIKSLSQSPQVGLNMRVGLAAGKEYVRTRFLPIPRTNFQGKAVNLAARVENIGKMCRTLDFSRGGVTILSECFPEQVFVEEGFVKEMHVLKGFEEEKGDEIAIHFSEWDTWKNPEL